MLSITPQALIKTANTAIKRFLFVGIVQLVKDVKMMSYQYTYFIGDLILLALWLILFLYRKDTRKEMLVISLVFGFIGPFVELVHVLDWWKPLTITGTIIGVEDVLFGFGIGGVASVVYEHLFNKRIKIKRVKKA